MALAAFVGTTRLIDNVTISVDDKSVLDADLGVLTTPSGKERH